MKNGEGTKTVLLFEVLPEIPGHTSEGEHLQAMAESGISEASGVKVGGKENVRDVQRPKSTEPRWQALLAILALCALYAALPTSLVFGGQRWLLLIVVLVMLMPAVIAHLTGNRVVGEVIGYILNGLVTVAVIWSLTLLILALPNANLTSQQLLLAAAMLWVAKILVFASWYWRLDAGGPHQRDLMSGHDDGAFLFPQMTMTPAAKAAANEQDWSPNFIDYLFLAFNTSTAFSPTDAMVLSRWAKILMMIQTIISLLIITLLAARAVNII
jgi:hypothetical protein